MRGRRDKVAPRRIVITTGFTETRVVPTLTQSRHEQRGGASIGFAAITLARVLWIERADAALRHFDTVGRKL